MVRLHVHNSCLAIEQYMMVHVHYEVGKVIMRKYIIIHRMGGYGRVSVVS